VLPHQKLLHTSAVGANSLQSSSKRTDLQANRQPPSSVQGRLTRAATANIVSAKVGLPAIALAEPSLPDTLLTEASGMCLAAGQPAPAHARSMVKAGGVVPDSSCRDTNESPQMTHANTGAASWRSQWPDRVQTAGHMNRTALPLVRQAAADTGAASVDRRPPVT
jgi:hypothetical protein